MKLPFVILKRSKYENMKEYLDYRSKRIIELKETALDRLDKINELEQKLKEAQKNDYRDPKTGRFAKRPQ